MLPIRLINPRKSRTELADGRRRCLVGALWAPSANPVGEPDAGNPHVRFDEREVETGSRNTGCADSVQTGHIVSSGRTAPRYLSTPLDFCCGSAAPCVSWFRSWILYDHALLFRFEVRGRGFKPSS